MESFSVKSLDDTLTLEAGAPASFSVADLGACYLNDFAPKAVSCDGQMLAAKLRRLRKQARIDRQKRAKRLQERAQRRSPPRRTSPRFEFSRPPSYTAIFQWEHCSEDSLVYREADRRMRAALDREKRRRRY